MKVLVIATSHKTRGGITSVIKAHKTSLQWNNFHCKWVGTHRDGFIILKVLFFIRALFYSIALMPFYDIVHIHLSEVRSARRKKIFIWIAKKMHKKVIVHLHAFSHRTTFEKYPQLYLNIFKDADKILVLSNQWKKWILEYLSYDENVTVLYNPCPVINQDKFVDRKKEILYAGTVNERKGYADLIRAFALVVRKYPDWKLIIAGNGEIAQGSELARKLKISDNVFFTGWISGSIKEKYFLSASIFCLPSYAEGFPMAVLDAWAYGLPIITTPVGGIPDVVVDGKNGLLFNPGDVNQLASSLIKLISDEDLRSQISIESIRLAQSVFSINTITKILADIYVNLGARPS